MYIPGRSRTGCRPLRIEMSLAAYATRVPLRRAPAEPLVSVLPHPVPARERPGERGCLRSVHCTRTVRHQRSSEGLIHPAAGAGHDDPNRAHDTGSAAALGTLHDLAFGVSQL